MIDLSIVIVNWNTRGLLAQCLESVGSEQCPVNSENSLPFTAHCSLSTEVIVVDNASTDGSAAMVRERFPWVQVIENRENVGFARANNLGMCHSQGRYVLLLNSDTVVPAGTVQRLVDIAESTPSIGAVGPLLRNPDGSFQAGPNDFPTPLATVLEAWGVVSKLRNNPHYPSYPPERCRTDQRCDWVGGACLLVRRATIDQIGLLDEQFFMNSEEVDWCRRMIAHGWIVWFTPQAHVVHLGGGSASRASAMQRLRLYEGKVRYLRKHHGPVAAVMSRWNYRFTSLLKATSYLVLYLLTRNDDAARKAASHWPVVRRRRWV